DGGQVHVGELPEFFVKACEFEIVSGEQRVAAVVFQQVTGNGVGEGKAVEGGSATPYLVHQHQTFFRGIVQDVGGFGHFNHEGGASAGEVVGCADAGEDLIQFAQHDLLRRNETAAVR